MHVCVCVCVCGGGGCRCATTARWSGSCTQQVNLSADSSGADLGGGGGGVQGVRNPPFLYEE